MKDKLVLFYWQRLIPMTLRIPIARRLAQHLWIKKMGQTFTESLANYEAIIRSANPDNAVLSAVKPYMAIMALMPAAMIYGYVKESQEVKTDDSQVSR